MKVKVVITGSSYNIMAKRTVATAIRQSKHNSEEHHNKDGHGNTLSHWFDFETKADAMAAIKDAWSYIKNECNPNEFDGYGHNEESVHYDGATACITIDK